MTLAWYGETGWEHTTGSTALFVGQVFKEWNTLDPPFQKH